MKKVDKMEIKTFQIHTLKLSEVPEELRDLALLCLTTDGKGTFHQVHYNEDEEDSELDKWILSNYPELKDLDYFFFEIDI